MDEKSESATKKKQRRIDLSVAQVAGSALAAAVAAFLAGQLGVYGTIIGAGVVSVVATTGGTLFQHLFRRTGEQIKEATVTTRPKPRSASRRTGTPPHGSTMVLPTFDKDGAEDGITSVAAATDSDGGGQGPATGHRPGPDADRTQMLPQADETRVLRPDGTAPAPRPTDKTQMVPRLDDPTMALGQASPRPAGATALPHGAGQEPEEISTATYGTKWRGWRRALIPAVVVFVLAMGIITGYELISGHTVDGKEKGTWISNVGNPGGGGKKQDQTPSTPQTPSPGHSTGEGTTGGSGKPSPDASPSPGTDGGTGGKTPTPSPNPSDSGKPAPTPTPTPSPDKSGSADGGTGADGGAGDSGGTGNKGGTDSGGGSGDNKGGGQQKPEGQQQAPDPKSS